MGVYRKSAMLALLHRRLQSDRLADWQTLARREREWYLTQEARGRWPLLVAWLRSFGEAETGAVPVLVVVGRLLALAAGFSLIAGLVEFRSFERINVLWFLSLAVFLPLLLWLFSLVAAASRTRFPLLALVAHKLPDWAGDYALRPLLRQTAVVLSQQMSLLFALGMLIAFLLYVAMTDLAFGWASTLDLAPAALHQVIDAVALPWRGFWPEAVPGLALVEQTQYFRSAPQAVPDPASLGQWWRFLLMCLLTYVLLPRLLSYGWFRLRLSQMQHALFTQDALISAWWDRLTEASLSHEAESVEQLGETDEASAALANLPQCDQILRWDGWPESEWQAVEGELRASLPGVPVHALDSNSAALPDGVAEREVLLVCKGWEPPTGELADLCMQLKSRGKRRYLWPVPLSGMSAARIAQLNRSWRAFMPDLPPEFNLVEQSVQRD